MVNDRWCSNRACRILYAMHACFIAIDNDDTHKFCQHVNYAWKISFNLELDWKSHRNITPRGETGIQRFLSSLVLTEIRLSPTRKWCFCLTKVNGDSQDLYKSYYEVSMCIDRVESSSPPLIKTSLWSKAKKYIFHLINQSHVIWSYNLNTSTRINEPVY